MQHALPSRPSAAITADSVASLMHWLRAWAPAIMAAGPADIERGTLEFHLQLPQFIISMLMTCASLYC